ncbi:ribonuclease E inhibitor RraB [Rhodanobacter sp. Root179]|uniref:ribonuclease E inhibitor RraB n=1 Tax=Rhodanobacter sp. Root179 TaxID=1736482 RepID=UPI0009E6F1BC|nr:ribonuclease E inhibitor RraB [Rhodanobacter sp. Root179]
MDANFERLIELFRHMEADGFDTSRPLKWGFFFFASTRASLHKVLEELVSHDYVVEQFEETEHENWVLQVSKTETLACEKLHRRNIAFNDLAESCGVDLYDGWDVGRG